MRIKLMCLLLAVQSCLMPYQTEVHQVITDEAFHLLKSFFPGVELSELGIQLGQIGNYGERQWQNGDVLTGAFREDLEDVVWGYGPASSFPITWLFVSSPTATPTHFWVADNGEDYKTPNVGWPWGGTHPNAYQKALKFINGG